MTAKYLPIVAAVYSSPAAHASDAGTVTGVADTGAATLIIGAACGLLLAMLLRPVVVLAANLGIRYLDDRALGKAMSAEGLKVMSDFIIPGAYGGLTRVDHAVMTPNGIMCVMYRDYKGLLFGSAEEPQWTSVDGATRQRFLNPVIQNQGRVAALQKALPGLRVAGVVVFGNRAEFQGPQPSNVVKVSELAQYLEQSQVAQPDIDDWDAAWLSLQSAAMTDEETRKDLDAQLTFG